MVQSMGIKISSTSMSVPIKGLYQLLFLGLCIFIFLSPAYCGFIAPSTPLNTTDDKNHTPPSLETGGKHHHSIVADYYIKTDNNTSMTLQRRSQNLSMDLTSNVKGMINRVGVTRGRTIHGYHSRHISIGSNDVSLKETTNAKEGYFESQEVTLLNSSITNYLGFRVSKPNGSDVYTFNLEENWPVFLVSRRDIDYSGIGICEKDLAYNNLDFVGSNFLYSKNLSRTRTCGLQLQKLDVTVLATKNSIFSYMFKPTKDTIYNQESRSLSGVSRVRYGQAGLDQTSMMHVPFKVTRSVEGDEIFKGDITHKVNLHMGCFDQPNLRSINNNTNMNNATMDNVSDHWLGCCYQDPESFKGGSGTLTIGCV